MVYVPPKHGEKPQPLTMLQESFLVCMLAGELADTSPYTVSVHFTSGYFVFMLGVNWQSYHRQLMDRLERQGWVTSRKLSRRWYYSLTPVARDAIMRHIEDGKIWSFRVLRDRVDEQIGF